jgi:hypothetical protein
MTPDACECGSLCGYGPRALANRRKSATHGGHTLRLERNARHAGRDFTRAMPTTSSTLLGSDDAAPTVREEGGVSFCAPRQGDPPGGKTAAERVAGNPHAHFPSKKSGTRIFPNVQNFRAPTIGRHVPRLGHPLGRQRGEAGREHGAR